MEFSARIEDRDLLALLQRIEQTFSPTGQKRVFEQWGTEIQDVFQIPYPAQSNAELPEHYDWNDGSGLHKFKSLHAQRGFFGALRSGAIDIPYRRTFETQKSVIWSLNVSDGEAELQVDVPIRQQNGRTVDPKWFLGNPQESYYFRELTEWRPLEETLEVMRERFEVLGATVLENILERVGNV